MWRLQEHRVWGHSPHKPEIGIGSFPENREREREREMEEHSGDCTLHEYGKHMGK